MLWHKAQGAGGLVGGGAGGWELVNAAYSGDSFSVAAQHTVPTGLYIKPDGTKFYVIGNATDKVSEYNLSTAWDITTGSFVQSFSISAQQTDPRGLFLSNHGLKLYITGNSGDDIDEYDLGTAWDISTASYSSTLSVSDSVPQDLYLSPDGDRLYYVGNGSDRVYQYSLSTSWDISTASFVQNLSISAQSNGPNGIFFKPDGTKMYINGDGNGVYQYDLSTAWDISTASFIDDFSVITQTDRGAAISFKYDDGKQFYVIANVPDEIFAYDL